MKSRKAARRVNQRISGKTASKVGSAIVVSGAGVRAPSHSSSSKTGSKSDLKVALGRIRGLEGEIAFAIRGMEEKVRQLECLTEFASLLNSTLDTDVVREKALEATCKLLGCETASLYLVDSKTGELFWESALGEAGQALKRNVRLPINDRSIAGYIAMSGESLVINDVEHDPRHFKNAAKKTQFQTRTMVCVPLKARDKVIGVLQALNKLPNVPPRPSRHEWPDFYESDLKLLQTLGHQVAIAVENSLLYTDLKKSFYDTVEALAETIEKKDAYTGGHTQRVVYYSLAIAKYLNLPPEKIERIRLGGLLHDIGKIGIEDAILKKQSQLSAEERRIIERHPALGYDIMCRVEGLRDVIGGMRYHHERWDGQGYPVGLKGEEIPLIARIIAVADTYDAMVSDRPYRKGLSPEIAFNEIVSCKDSQFDPTVVEAFVQAFRNDHLGEVFGSTSDPVVSRSKVANYG